MEDIEITFSFRKDEELDIMDGHGEVSLITEEDLVKIGLIHFNYYNGYFFEDLIDLQIISDAISGDELYMLSELTGEQLLEGSQLITLDRVIIEKEFESEELEKDILKKFIEDCRYFMFDTILVIASNPINPSKDQKVLEFPKYKLYSELNFYPIGGSDKKTPVMLKNLHLKG